MAELFDLDLRDKRRDRAARTGAATFLHDRAFEDILDRLALIQRPLANILLLGALNPDWRERLAATGAKIRTIDPTPLIADAANGQAQREHSLDVEPGSMDCAIAIGTLDTVNDLPGALLRLRFALAPDGLLIGAMAGGDSLPLLRSAMRQADQASSGASPHVHPRIDPASLSALLGNAGFMMPVVDVDRVRLRYPTFARLVADLRAMGATNVLRQRSPNAIGKAGFEAARDHAHSQREKDGKFAEFVDVLHFMGWSPK